MDVHTPPSLRPHEFWWWHNIMHSPEYLLKADPQVPAHSNSLPVVKGSFVLSSFWVSWLESTQKSRTRRGATQKHAKATGGADKALKEDDSLKKLVETVTKATSASNNSSAVSKTGEGPEATASASCAAVSQASYDGQGDQVKPHALREQADNVSEVATRRSQRGSGKDQTHTTETDAPHSTKVHYTSQDARSNLNQADSTVKIEKPLKATCRNQDKPTHSKAKYTDCACRRCQLLNRSVVVSLHEPCSPGLQSYIWSCMGQFGYVTEVSSMRRQAAAWQIIVRLVYQISHTVILN